MVSPSFGLGVWLGLICVPTETKKSRQSIPRWKLLIYFITDHSWRIPDYNRWQSGVRFPKTILISCRSDLGTQFGCSNFWKKKNNGGQDPTTLVYTLICQMNILAIIETRSQIIPILLICLYQTLEQPSNWPQNRYKSSYYHYSSSSLLSPLWFVALSVFSSLS